MAGVQGLELSEGVFEFFAVKKQLASFLLLASLMAGVQGLEPWALGFGEMVRPSDKFR